MNRRVRIPTLTTFIGALLLCACASKPPADAGAAHGSGAPAPVAASDAERPPPPAGQKRYKWTKASEEEVAAQLDRKFHEAAKSFVQLKRDNQLMFCKKYREMGTNIRTLHCITEAELRKQVEDSDEVREQMRNRIGKCVMGRAEPCGGN
jgi:hypothetical protein